MNGLWNLFSVEVIDTIDFTTKPKKSISTLLVSSSILNGIRTSYLKPNKCSCKNFPRRTVDSLRTKLGDYDLTNARQLFCM